MCKIKNKNGIQIEYKLPLPLITVNNVLTNVNNPYKAHISAEGCHTSNNASKVVTTIPITNAKGTK